MLSQLIRFITILKDGKPAGIYINPFIDVLRNDIIISAGWMDFLLQMNALYIFTGPTVIVLAADQ